MSELDTVIRQLHEEKTIVVRVDIASELHFARAFDWRGVELGKYFPLRTVQMASAVSQNGYRD